MKKFFLMMVVMCSMTTAFAEGENLNAAGTIDAYEININMNKLSEALDLANDQKDAVENIHNEFNTEMTYATQYDSADREIMVKRAINTDVKRMSYVLNEEQMSKYIALLNATIANRGLKK